MSGPDRRPCALCDHPSVGHINDIAFCRTHTHDAIRLAIHIEALEQGADPECIETIVTQVLTTAPLEELDD